MEKQHGLTAVITRGNISMIRRMGRAFFIGAMGSNTLVDGKRGNRMVKEFIFQLAGGRGRGCGKMGRELLGWSELHRRHYSRIIYFFFCAFFFFLVCY